MESTNFLKFFFKFCFCKLDCWPRSNPGGTDIFLCAYFFISSGCDFFLTDLYSYVYCIYIECSRNFFLHLNSFFFPNLGINNYISWSAV